MYVLPNKVKQCSFMVLVAGVAGCVQGTLTRLLLSCVFHFTRPHYSGRIDESQSD